MYLKKGKELKYETSQRTSLIIPSRPQIIPREKEAFA